MRVQGNTLLGSSANKIKDKIKRLTLGFFLSVRICICMQVSSSTWNEGESCGAALQEAAAG